MKILIIEDEELAVKKLHKMLIGIDDSIEVIANLDSIESSVEWLENNETPDLIMMDIELLDGQSFEIFNRVKVKSPVIFTTSYDEYALKAFKVNSVDYLLKPIQREDLAAALNKYRQMFAAPAASQPSINMDMLVKELQQKLQPREYRKRFLVKNVQKLVSVETDDIAYFYSDGRLNFFKTTDNKKYVVDYTMDELDGMLDPDKYFRISRSFFVSIDSVDQINDYFGNRLILTLKPAVDKEALVSREKVTDFKKWLGK
ncbi:MAG TPA: LytTR family DNA-binding domain-containing protein [Ferruginibacter sp.]|jgi:DNA-binding LytR/AlgR family response regulator|nr:response regulator transcription factor [Chitinophagales bacterium]HMU71217.1 LytTR family DNA-binding domain-containing protein [Ferruginibacter sp.]HMX78966.1 LytTR family DNA-binding domain-containing protein [Ferruginibacter sp.]HNA00024.1 LytTR family DNA-binding domain-containing protein [Ferruginibacter sp.]HNA17446.1 LytTR family DNA-binding domain-containing protein [Ferruginibacter sp.]